MPFWLKDAYFCSILVKFKSKNEQKEFSFGRNWPVSAERCHFGYFCFRQKLVFKNSSLSVLAETLLVDHYTQPKDSSDQFCVVNGKFFFFSALIALAPICLRITWNAKKCETQPRDTPLPQVDDLIAPTEQERIDRVRYATGGTGGIPRWARIFKKAQERREGTGIIDGGK